MNYETRKLASGKQEVVGYADAQPKIWKGIALLQKSITAQRVWNRVLTLVLFFSLGSANAAPTIGKEAYDRINEINSHISAGRHEQARQLAHETLESVNLTDYELGNLYNIMAFNDYQHGDLLAAVENYEKLLSLPPEDIENFRLQTMYTAAQLYFLLEKYDEARNHLNEYVGLQRKLKPAELALYGQVLFHEKQYASAARWIKRAVEDAESLGDEAKEGWWKLLALCQIESGQTDVGVDTHELILMRWPTEANFKSAVTVYISVGDANRASVAMDALLSQWPDSDQVKPLHLATARGDNTAIQQLIDSGIEVDQQTSHGYTPLGLAARFGLEATVLTLVDLGASLDGNDNLNVMPITLAAVGGHDTLVDQLWSAGADPTIHSETSYGLLPHIARLDNPDLLARLIGKYPELIEVGGSEALRTAAANGLADTYNTLIENGATYDSGEAPPIPLLLAAASGGNMNIMNAVIESGINVNARDDGMLDALSVASRAGHIDAVNALLANGAKTDNDLGEGYLVMHEAARGGSAEIVRVLIDAGAAVDEIDDVGFSPIMYAVNHENFELIPLFLDAGADANRSFKNDATLLSKMARSGRMDHVVALLDAGADVNGNTASGGSPLASAIFGNHIEIVKTLVEAGAAINAPIYRGVDSLHLGVIAGEPDIVAVLLEGGAKPDGGVKKLTQWSRSDVRRFLKKHGFKRTKGTVPETWVRTSPEGTTNTIVVPEMRGNYTLPDLTRIMKESGLDAGIWMGLQDK